MGWLKRLFELRKSQSESASVRRICTVSFTNMTNYVSIAEWMPLEQLPVFMNRYFECQTEQIHRREGIVDKYIGDIIMSYWTKPHLDAQLACEAALDQMAEMADFHLWAAANGFPSPGIRIGINSGAMQIGEMGTKYLRARTVAGDEVNLASRLEGRAKEYGVRTLISEATRQRLSDDLITRQIDRLRVKGREGTVDIFELVCRKGELSPERETFLGLYRDGMNHYFGQRYAEAILSFEGAVALVKRDGPCELYIARCRRLMREFLPGAVDET